jgi:CubicO group peptidase (beta-lactamase class C family)
MRLRATEELLEKSVGAVFPSAQLVVVNNGERESFAVGDANESTIFDLASLTKPLVTATLIGWLIEQERATLYELVDQRFPVRALLCHAAGLPAWRDLRPAVLDGVRWQKLEYEPWTKSVYSDLGYLLLGEMIEQRHEKLDVAFRKRVTDRLELGLTFAPDPKRCAPTEGDLRGIVHDDNARAMGGVAGHAGLFGTAMDVSRLVSHLVDVWHGTAGVVGPKTMQRFWSPAGVPRSTWCLGWDRPAKTGSSAGERWPKTGVGHLAFTGCSIWIDPPRRRHVVLLSNRVYPSRSNELIKQLRPELHDTIVKELDD